MARSSKWWKLLSPKQKKAYLKAHPNSLYGFHGPLGIAKKMAKAHPFAAAGLAGGLAAAAGYAKSAYDDHKKALADEASKARFMRSFQSFRDSYEKDPDKAVQELKGTMKLPDLSWD